MASTRQPGWCQLEDIDPQDCPLIQPASQEERFCSHCGKCNISALIGGGNRTTVRAGEPVSFRLPVVNEGPGEPEWRAEITPPSDFHLTPIGKTAIQITGPALEAGEAMSVTITLRTHDGKRDPSNFSNRRPLGPPSSHNITVEALELRPEFSLTGALLHRTRTEQILTLSVPQAAATGSLRVRLSAEGEGFTVLREQAVLNDQEVLISSDYPCRLQVKLNENAKEAKGRLLAKNDQGHIVGECRILYVPKERRKSIQKKYTIGIDFGTSGTSVYVLESGKGKSWSNFQPILDNEGVVTDDSVRRRWPSIIFMPTEHKSTWVYGILALNRLEQAAASKEGGFASRIKSRLRADDLTLPVTISGKDKSFCALDLAKSLFVEIRRRTEEALPALKQHITDGGQVDVYVSLPVLDSNEGGALFMKQRLRTLEAARFAFDVPDSDVDNGEASQFQISEIMEPEAAAYHLVLLAQDEKLQTFSPNKASRPVTFKDGETILVYDSGGGTTDIALGTLRVRDRKIELEDVVSFSSTRHDGRPYGGTAVTDALIRNLWSDEDEGDKWRILTKDIEEDPNKELPDEAELSSNDLWHQFFPKFWQRIEEAKVSLSKGVEGNVIRGNREEGILLDDHILEDYGEGKDVNKQAEILNEIITDCRNDGKRIEWVFLVGGNSNLHCLQLKLQELVKGPQIVVPQSDERDFSLLDFVPAGVCLKSVQPLITSACQVRIIFEGDYDAADIVFPRGMIGSKPFLRDLFPGTWLQVCIEGVAGWDGPEVVRRFQLPGGEVSDDDSTTVNYRFVIEQGRLVFSCEIDGSYYDDVLYYL